ncbi:MAG: class I SAM-dependent methyltransferase [Hyphomicrobiaceae bacterium]
MTQNLDPHVAGTRPSDTSRQSACPACGSARPRDVIYRVDHIPIQSCVLLTSRDEAVNYPRRDLELVCCRDCGFICNHIFDQSIVEYATVTEESQHFSGTFNGFAKRLAREIADRVPLDHKHILEIGCGKGDFLIELCKLANCTGLGIDPGFSHVRLDATDFNKDYDTARIKFIADYYGPAYMHLAADLIMCRHTLEHIGPVAQFVRDIRAGIAHKFDTKVFFETPSADRVLTEGAFWDIYYEHCSYFTPGTHAELFMREGYDVDEVRLDYDDQYIIQYARPHSSDRPKACESKATAASISALVETFGPRVTETQERWGNLIREWHARGKRVTAWGGGSKCVSFLTTLKLDREIAGVVDINPFKQGKFLPGTGHQVIAPKDLKAVSPDVVIIMNPIYVQEISEFLRDIDLAPTIIAV